MTKYQNVKLSDVCEIVSGSTPKTNISDFWDGEYKWITPAELNDKDKRIFDTERHISLEAIKQAHLRLLPKGTVLFSSRAPIGKVAIADDEMYCNQGFKNFICSSRLLNEYLYYYLKYNSDYIKSIGRGATFKEVSKEQVGSLQIYLPSLDIQKTRSEILSIIDSIVEKKYNQLQKLDEIQRSRFIEMFGDPVKNTKNWPTKKMKEVAPLYKSSVQPKLNAEGKVWLLNLDQVEAETGIVLNYFYQKPEELGSSTSSFSTNCVLYSKLRPYLNKVVIPDREGYSTNEMISLAVQDQLLCKSFLATLLRSKEFVTYINSRVAGTKMPRVQLTDFWEFPVILPPLGSQKQFANVYDQLNKSKLAIQKSIEELETLKKKLMQEYFG